MIVLLLLLLFGAVLFAERCKNVPTKTTKISAVEKECCHLDRENYGFSKHMLLTKNLMNTWSHLHREHTRRVYIFNYILLFKHDIRTAVPS